MDAKYGQVIGINDLNEVGWTKLDCNYKSSLSATLRLSGPETWVTGRT
ncbi:hypothetical protein ABIE49_004009 [Bradyrhizobium sp. OAE829]